MGYFSRLKKMIISVFLIFGTLPLIIAGSYMIYLGDRAAYNTLVVMGVGSVIFAVASLVASVAIVLHRINPVENAADKLIDTFGDDEKEVLRLSSGKSPSRFIGGTMDYLAGERMAAGNHICRQELFETASLCTGRVIWLREKRGDSFVVPDGWKKRYPGFKLENGTPIEDYIHPDDKEGFTSALQVVTAAAGRFISVNFRLVYEDICISAAAEIRSVETDGIICAAGAVSDICSADSSETDAREKHLMYNFAVSAVNDIIYELDTEKDCFDIMNKERWESMFGLPLNGTYSVCRSEYAKLIHPDYLQGFLDRFSAVDSLLFMPERTMSYDYRIKKKDGNFTWVRHTIVCVKEKDGRACKIVGLISDLTEKNRREQETA